MVKGRPWSKEQVKQLRSMVKAGATLEEIAGEFKKAKGAIRIKLRRLGLKVVEVVPSEKNSDRTSTSSFDLPIPEELPSIEEQLLNLAGAIEKLKAGDLSKVDVMRLRGLISGVKQYKELYAEYVGYCVIEQKVESALEMLRKLDKKS